MSTALTLNNIQKRWDKDLFAPVSFTLNPGEGIAIYGQNGSGKTTILDIIAGLEPPSAGSFSATGRIGYVMQHAGFLESLSFKDNLMIEAYLSGLRGEEAKQQVGLVAARLEMTPFWTKRYSKGSSGMRGRLSVAAALLAQPQILLLDEAFNYLDQRSQEQTHFVLRAEKERGAALVMVSHNSGDFNGLCERVLQLPEATITTL